MTHRLSRSSLTRGTGLVAAGAPADRRNIAPLGPVVRSSAGKAIEDSTETGAVQPGATGSRVVRAQILLDRARFSPGEIDGVYGDDFGIAVKGYQESHALKPTGTNRCRDCGAFSMATPAFFC